MTDAEKRVRAAWANVVIDGSWERKNLCVCVCSGDSLLGSGETLDEAFAAALAFTEARLEEIKKMEAVIQWASDARIVGSVKGYDVDSKRHTIIRLEAFRDDLKQGMK
jgi:hypothetical protein